MLSPTANALLLIPFTMAFAKAIEKTEDRQARLILLFWFNFLPLLVTMTLLAVLFLGLGLDWNIWTYILLCGFYLNNAILRLRKWDYADSEWAMLFADQTAIGVVSLVIWFLL